MPVISSIFLLAAWVLAVVIGPQTRPWTWGPSMVALGIALAAAVPAICKRGKAQADSGLLALGLLVAAWFAWRAWEAPVRELGQADLLLLGGVVGAFVSVRAISGHDLAERILGWGMALLLLASLVVMGRQLADPQFTPVFRSHGAALPAGFFASYNEEANYLIASAMIVGAAALFGRHALATRLLWLALAMAGLAGVWFTSSRGGIFGAAVGCGVFAAMALMIGKSRGARWFAPALVAIPVIGLGIGAFLFMGWQNAQNVRFAGVGITSLLDNSCRLYFLGAAVSCVSLHPLLGGGSQSYGWECYRFLDGKTNGGIITHNPKFVHNEWVQSATDYGLAGAGLLGGFLGALALAAVLRVMFETVPAERDGRDAWRIGGLAALAGMLVQSCFSFVFHMMPGALLLGVCLGLMSWSAPRSPATPTFISRMLLTVAAFASVMLLLPAGWTGCRVLRILWPTYFGDPAATSAEARIDALGDALRLWPQAAFYESRGRVLQDLAGPGVGPGFRESAERASDDYQAAFLLNSYDPWLAVNRAVLLSQLQRDAEAEKWFAAGIALQGGMEPAFRGHFSFANHYLRKGLRQFRPEAPAAARATLELAAEQIEAAGTQMHWITDDMVEPGLLIHESLGNAREAAGDQAGALQSYIFAATLAGGNRANYLAGLLLEKIAIDEFKQRAPGKAMAHFLEARGRVGAASQLPQGTTPKQRDEHLAALDRMIGFLRGAKIEPEK